MILHYFNKKENDDRKIANKIYLSLIDFIQYVLSKSDIKIKKNFNSSFELMTIFLFAIFFSYKKNPKNKYINQYLMDLYIIDLDKSLRDSGVGDMSVGKYVKSYVKKFYYRISKLETIFTIYNFNEFNKYINRIDIQRESKNSTHLSKYLFITVKDLLKRAKRNDLSKLTFMNPTN